MCHSGSVNPLLRVGGRLREPFVGGSSKTARETNTMFGRSTAGCDVLSLTNRRESMQQDARQGREFHSDSIIPNIPFGRAKSPGRSINRSVCLAISLSFIASALRVSAQTNEAVQPPSELKKLSLEDLFAMEVTSVSKKPEKLSETAAAIHVVTDEDIRRSGALSIPEALRDIPGVEVAQVDSRQYAITARGFNGTVANKLLVLIDGRSVYTPLFSGVFWDVQDTFMEDIARIEVIRAM